MFSTPLMIAGNVGIHVDVVSWQIICHVKLTPARHYINLRPWQYPGSAQSRESSLCFLLIPLLSDHSFIIAKCDCSLSSTTSIGFRLVWKWSVIDVDAFAMVGWLLVYTAHVFDQVSGRVADNSEIAAHSADCTVCVSWSFWYRDGVSNTSEENTSISLIQIH